LQYSYHVRQIEQELVITHGWLKPYKMNELAGAPALDKQQKDLEQRKKDARLSEIKEKAYKLTLSRQTSRQLSVSCKKLSKKNIAVTEWNEALDSVAHKIEWRNLFSEDEMDEAYQKIASNRKLTESPRSSGSDSSEYGEMDELHPDLFEESGEIEFSKSPDIKKSSKMVLKNSSSKSVKINRFGMQSCDKDRYSSSDLGVKNEFTKTQIFTPLYIEKLQAHEASTPFPDIKSRHNKAIHITTSTKSSRIIRSSTLKSRTYARASVSSKDPLIQIRSAFAPAPFAESQSPDRSLNRPKSANSKNKAILQSNITKIVKQYNKKLNLVPDSPETLQKQPKSFTVQCVKVQLKPKNKYTTSGRTLSNYVKR
jgi:hypothetical protein